MKENVTLKYGEETVTFKIEGARSLGYIESNAMNTIENLNSELRDILSNPIKSDPLNQIISKGDKVTVVISDITRLWMRQDIIVPHLVEYLNELGIIDEDICILIATGTHRSQTVEEHTKLVTQNIYNRIRIVDHDCDSKELVYVGTTRRGTKVKVNPLVVNRKVICIGAVTHHIMAGYGGGRKSIVPGVAGRETINKNHLHSLSPDSPKSNPLIGLGALEENPLNEDIIEACSFVNPDFIISLAVSTIGTHSKLFGGHWLYSWLEGCRWINHAYGVNIDKKADIVIASCGGFPKDISLYQTTKSFFNAREAVNEGGTIVIIAECREGGGGEDFFGWNTPLEEGRLDEALRQNFTIPGYIFYAAVEVSSNYHVKMLTRLDKETVKPMNIEAYDNIDDLMKSIDFIGKDIWVIPYAGSTVPLLKNNPK